MKKILISLLITTSIVNSSLFGMDWEQDNDATNYSALAKAIQYLRIFKNAEFAVIGHQQDLEIILSEKSALSEDVQTTRNQIALFQELINTTKQGLGYKFIEATVNSKETNDQKNALLGNCEQTINTTSRIITEESTRLNNMMLQLAKKAYPEEPEPQEEQPAQAQDDANQMQTAQNTNALLAAPSEPARALGTLEQKPLLESDRQEETIWNVSLPRLTFTKKGWFSSLCNRIWPQIPSLRIDDQQHVINATQKTKKLTTKANEYLAQTSSRENLHAVNVAAENSPAQALALHKQAMKHWLTTGPTRFSATNLLTTIHTARTWRLCLSAATAIGYGAHKALKNMRFTHPKILAIPCAAIAFFATKPMFNALNRAILKKTYRDDANEAVRQQYITQLRERNLMAE